MATEKFYQCMKCNGKLPNFPFVIGFCEACIPEEPPQECYICLELVPAASGATTCSRHFLCNPCSTLAFARAINHTDEFPLTCCPNNPIPLSSFTAHLPPTTTAKYLAKTEEHSVPAADRVYCSRPACAAFIPPSASYFDPRRRQTVAVCKCGTKTCHHCKQRCARNHRCPRVAAPVRPEWLPPYTAECRVKKCPECATWIEHREACNHMRCSHCRVEFCFVCLRAPGASGFQCGCQMYGDPEYDAEGYSVESPRIHRDTGKDRKERTVGDLGGLELELLELGIV